MTPAASERWRVRLPLIAAAGVSWLGALFLPTREGFSFCDASVWISLSADKLRFLLSGTESIALFLGWILMVAAMMTPMLTRNVAHVRARSISAIRTWGTAFFLFGFLALWLLVGIPFIGILFLTELMQSHAIVTVSTALLISVLWQFSPAKQFCLNRCHRTPALRGSGVKFVASVFRYGYMQGVWCFGTCWAIMLVALFAGEWHKSVMVLASGFLLAERLEKPKRPGWEVRYPTAVIKMVAFRISKQIRFDLAN
jgi:predicted metal-binding membrane protein